MLIAFLWFTIGTTYVVVEQLKQSNTIAATKDFNTDSENTPDPFANATEEKGENSSTIFISEYLREENEHLLHADGPLKHNKYHSAEIFAAFYGESVSPPPEISLC
jgi:hypothetical protein